MDNILTPDEIAFLEKLKIKRDKHILAQAKYRANNKNKIDDYNKKYNDDLKAKKQEINKKLINNIEPPKIIDIQKIIEPPKIDKRTKRGKKQALTQDITPSYLNRKQPLEYSTIEDYIKKANIINKKFNNKDLPQDVKNELKKLLNDNANLNEKLILNEMKYLLNIQSTINTLRNIYKNDNSFKSYINILTVITSHFKTINSQTYQILSKIGKSTNETIQEEREKNELAEEDENKIINIDKNEVLANIKKLDNIDDILIYALYTLFPSRRLDYRNMKITYETNKDKLNDINYLIIDSPKRFIFNDYKTYKKYGKQDFIIDSDLDKIINRYINAKKLKNGDYLFSLERDKNEILSQPNFTNKIINVFKKIYNVPISVRFIRMSWASSLYNTNMSMKDIKDIAFKMSHSLNESRLYNKIFKKNLL